MMVMLMVGMCVLPSECVTMARVSVLLLLLLCAVSSFVASQDAPAAPTTAVQQVRSHATQHTALRHPLPLFFMRSTIITLSFHFQFSSVT